MSFGKSVNEIYIYIAKNKIDGGINSILTTALTFLSYFM